jgi:hypothetical protein
LNVTEVSRPDVVMTQMPSIDERPSQGRRPCRIAFDAALAQPRAEEDDPSVPAEDAI